MLIRSDVAISKSYARKLKLMKPEVSPLFPPKRKTGLYRLSIAVPLQPLGLSQYQAVWRQIYYRINASNALPEVHVYLRTTWNGVVLESTCLKKKRTRFNVTDFVMDDLEQLPRNMQEIIINSQINDVVTNGSIDEGLKVREELIVRILNLITRIGRMNNINPEKLLMERFAFELENA